MCLVWTVAYSQRSSDKRLYQQHMFQLILWHGCCEWKIQSQWAKSSVIWDASQRSSKTQAQMMSRGPCTATAAKFAYLKIWSSSHEKSLFQSWRSRLSHPALIISECWTNGNGLFQQTKSLNWEWRCSTYLPQLSTVANRRTECKFIKLLLLPSGLDFSTVSRCRLVGCDNWRKIQADPRFSALNCWYIPVCLKDHGSPWLRPFSSTYWWRYESSGSIVSLSHTFRRSLTIFVTRAIFHPQWTLIMAICVPVEVVTLRKSISRLWTKLVENIQKWCKNSPACEKSLKSVLGDLELSPGKSLRKKAI
jgi:hypothetical protein